MKKGLLFILGMLMMVSTAEATNGKIPNSEKGYHYRYGAKTIKFVERGVKFYVFPNGELDFKRHKKYRTQYYYRNGRRYKKQIPLRGVRVQRDYFGRVKKVGNVHISYNRFGKVSRVGSIFIDYYRGRKMTRVGGLHIRYDRYGRIKYSGKVKYNYNDRFDNYYFDDFAYDYDDDFFYNDGFYNDYEEYNEDDDFYYYRSKSKKGLKNGKKHAKIIKRKKLKKNKQIKDRKRRR